MAVMLNGPSAGNVDAARIVDRVLAPALAFAWAEGRRAGVTAIAVGIIAANPYQAAVR